MLVFAGADVNQANEDVCASLMTLDLVFSSPLQGWTPLHAASFNGHLDVVKLLVRFSLCEYEFISSLRVQVEGGADVDWQNIEGTTPLYHACKKGRYRIAKFLCLSGPLNCSCPISA